MLIRSIKTVAGFTAYPWEHALPVLRLSEPIQQAGLNFLRGNDYDIVYLDRISQADVVVIQRDFPRWKSAYDQVRARARQEGKPVVYEIDDLLLDLTDTHPDRSIHYYTRALLPMIRAIIDADAVTATTPALCDYLRPLNPNIWLLPNYHCDRLWPEKALSQAPLQPKRDEVIIGYMGSDTHLPDLEMLTPVYQRLLDRFGNRLRLKFWAAPPPAELREHAAVEWIPVRIWSYAEFAEFFARQECDIFVAPLVDNLFNRCKSAIKYFEYSALGIPGVYSRVAPYEQVVVHGENGFLADTSAEWESALARLVEDQALRQRMGVQAAETVKQDWSLSGKAHRWPEIYAQAIGAAANEATGDTQVEGSDLARIVVRTAEQVQDWTLDLEKRLADRESELQSLQSGVAEREQQSQVIRASLQEKEEQIAHLNSQLYAIYTSRGWALLQALKRIRCRLIPEGSRREQILRSFFGR
jgi:glycosyltransferase involved in cell wall biosynthesis